MPALRWGLSVASGVWLCAMVRAGEVTAVHARTVDPPSDVTSPTDEPPTGPGRTGRPRNRRSSPDPQRPDFGVPTDQGKQKTCWSYAIGNAVARAAQLQYGRVLRPDDIAAWIKTELCWFKGTDPPSAIRFLESRTADPERPVAFGCYTWKGENLVPDGTAVCVQVKNIRQFSSQYVPLKGVKEKEKTVKQRSGPGEWPALLACLSEGPDAAVISKWSKVDGDLLYGGHAVCFMEVLSDEAVLCKNSWLRKPTLVVTESYFKRAVVFDVALHEVGPPQKPTGGKRRALSIGRELLRAAGRPADVLYGHVDFALWHPLRFLPHF